MPRPKELKSALREAKARENDAGHEMGNAVNRPPRAGGYTHTVVSRCRHCCRTVTIHVPGDGTPPWVIPSGGYTWGCLRHRPPHVNGVPQFHTAEGAPAAPPASYEEYVARGLRNGPPPAPAPAPASADDATPEPAVRFIDL